MVSDYLEEKKMKDFEQYSYERSLIRKVHCCAIDFFFPIQDSSRPPPTCLSLMACVHER